MKFTTDKSSLVTALGRCIPVADPKATIPTLSHVLIKTWGVGVRLSATDLFRSVTTLVTAKIDGEGALCLPARELLERVKQLPDGTIALSTEGTQATLRTVGSQRRFTLHGIPSEEFPTIPDASRAQTILTTDTHKLAELFGAVHHAISTDEGRQQLNSMLLESERDAIRVVAVDGHRLCAITDGGTPTDRAPKWLVPLAAVNDLRKLCDGKQSETVTLKHAEPNLFFEIGELTFCSKMPEGEFPPWQQLIPPAPDHVISINRAALVDSLRAVSVSSNDRTGGVRFVFRANELTIQAEDHTKGDGFDVVETDYQGKETEIGFNARYVLDALSALACETITLSISGALDPALFHAAGREDFLGLVMPMKV